MTSKRFKKLLMGKYCFSKYDAEYASSFVVCKDKTLDGKDFFYHISNDSYDKYLEYLFECMDEFNEVIK